MSIPIQDDHVIYDDCILDGSFIAGVENAQYDGQPWSRDISNPTENFAQEVQTTIDDFDPSAALSTIVTQGCFLPEPVPDFASEETRLLDISHQHEFNLTGLPQWPLIEHYNSRLSFDIPVSSSFYPPAFATVPLLNGAPSIMHQQSSDIALLPGVGTCPGTHLTSTCPTFSHTTSKRAALQTEKSSKPQLIGKPDTKKRRKTSNNHTQAEWNNVKDAIYHLYISEGCRINELAELMTKVHGFTASFVFPQYYILVAILCD
jgi:hypothetical protein